MNKFNIDLNKFYTNTEISQMLGVSHVTVFNRIKKGEIIAKKIGRNYAIKGSDLNDYLNPSDILSDNRKKIIEDIVQKTVSEYSEALIKLGQE